jgi:tetratricopeptide (TPR) repeat protein
MQIFLAWSGDRSRAIALAFHTWLTTIIQRAEPWVSERDIEMGQRWSEGLATKIKEARFSVLCLTPENTESPWLHFEAGALLEVMGQNRIVPLTYKTRMADVKGPLAQFQGAELNLEGIRKLTLSINRALDSAALDPEQVTRLVDRMWPDLETSIKAIGEAKAGAAMPAGRTDRELLEEILSAVRGAPQSGRLGSDDELEGSRWTWEEHYVRGVQLANARDGATGAQKALEEYQLAIARFPRDRDQNLLGRLYTYSGAMLKRLGRLEEASGTLRTGEKLVQLPREVEDNLYNQACVASMSRKYDRAISLARKLIHMNAKYARILKQSPYFERLRDNPDFFRLLA